MSEEFRCVRVPDMIGTAYGHPILRSWCAKKTMNSLCCFACVKSLSVVVFGYTQSLLERFVTHFLLLPLIY